MSVVIKKNSYMWYLDDFIIESGLPVATKGYGIFRNESNMKISITVEELFKNLKITNKHKEIAQRVRRRYEAHNS